MRILVAYRQLPNGGYDVASFWGLLLNRWALLRYAHNMGSALVTGSFAMARPVPTTCRGHVPTADLHARYLAPHRPVTAAAMEGLFKSERGAPIVILGQPDG